MRAILLLSSLFAAGCGASAGVDPLDTGLVGVWQARGTVMTASMQRTGTFLLRIASDGTYALVSTGGPDFVADTGRFTQARAGGYVRQMPTGLEDRGQYSLTPERLRFTSIYGELEATRAPSGAGEPGLTRLATMARIPVRNHVSHWTARAAQYAALWQRDARLEYVSLTGFDERGLLKTDTSVTIGFYSPSQDRFLLLSPAPGGRSSMVLSTMPRGDRAVGSRAIPLPIVDLAILANRQRQAGQRARYSAADLRFVSQGGASRLLWVARLEVSNGLDRHCLDVARAEVVDCRAVAGDPRADLAQLEQRAAAAWASMQSRLGAGDTSSGDFSYVPPTDFERCGLRGGSHNGVGCFATDGAEIR